MTAALFRAVPRPLAERLPVLLITGFLGSGKTTLINHILREAQGLRAAVLVNEFGEIGIDGALIVAAEGGLVELANGCICCSINNDLVGALARLLERAEALDLLIVETTGLADPLPVALTLLRSEFREALRLDAIVALADAVEFAAAAERGPLARQQLRHADIVLLNKCDQASPAALAEIETGIRALNPAARLLRSVRGAVPLPLLFDCERTEPGRRLDALLRQAGTGEAVGADAGFVAFSFVSERPLSALRFQRFLEQERPAGLFRAKGFLGVAETGRRYLFHLVGGRFALEEAGAEAPSGTRLVLIGRDLDRADLEGRLTACLA